VCLKEKEKKKGLRGQAAGSFHPGAKLKKKNARWGQVETQNEKKVEITRALLWKGTEQNKRKGMRRS